MRSKVIQIETGTAGESHYLYALCEDGTIWCWFAGTWTKVM